MDNFKKLVVVPFDATNGKTENLETSKPETHQVSNTLIRKPESSNIKIRRSARIENILKIILSLPRINGYNDKGEIRSGDTYVDSSNIAQLILYAVTAGKALVGENDFINLLVEVDIDPYLILNERIKSKISSKPKHTFESQKEATVTSTVSDIRPNVVNKTYKRTLDDTDDDEPKRKKQLVNWTIPNSGDEDSRYFKK